MTDQPPQPETITEFAILEKTFKLWNVENSNRPQALFAHTSKADTLGFAVYCTPDDHPATVTPEAWITAFENRFKGQQRRMVSPAGGGWVCPDPSNGRIKGIILCGVETLRATGGIIAGYPKWEIPRVPGNTGPVEWVRQNQTIDPVYVEWVREKLHWLWQQGFANTPYPIIRTMGLPRTMSPREIHRAEFPISKADEWLPWLFDKSPEKRYQSMRMFLQTEDREWLPAIIRVLGMETEAHIIAAAFDVIEHFNAENDAAVYLVERVAVDKDAMDMNRYDNGSIDRDINKLRRLGAAAVPAMLKNFEQRSGHRELLDLLVASGDARVKPALEALVEAPTTTKWMRSLFVSGLDKLNKPDKE